MNGQENYLSRHPLLSLTSPEASSLIRIRSLNQHNIECFPTITCIELAALLNQNIYGTVTNQVIVFSGIYKKIVAGNRSGGLRDTYF